MPDTKTKETLRKAAKKIRNKESLSKKEYAGTNAANFFFKNISIDNNSIVALYHPTNNELSTIELLKELSLKNIITCLPVIKEVGKPLDFKKWQYGEQLVQSKFFNIKEPIGKCITPNIIILPLLAFDKNLNRLGYGGGFYDRTLKYLNSNGSSYISIGYAYSFQEVDAVPTNENDVPLDYIITEEKIFKK